MPKFDILYRKEITRNGKDFLNEDDEDYEVKENAETNENLRIDE